MEIFLKSCETCPDTVSVRFAVGMKLLFPDTEELCLPFETALRIFLPELKKRGAVRNRLPVCIVGTTISCS